MSDLIKAQNMPQFNWYTQWTSLGADGMPDNIIEEGLKQPDWIKVSFEKGTKEITSHVAPDQARFGKQDGACQPAQNDCLLQAVSSNQQGGWHSLEDCQG